MLKKILSVNDCENNMDAVIKGVFVGLAFVGAAGMISVITTIIVRRVVRDEIEKLK